MHQLELYGMEGCCDGTTTWLVNGGAIIPAKMLSW